MPPPHRHLAALLAPVALAALVLAGACVSDPAAPADRARLSVRASVHGNFQVAEGSYLEVSVQYFRQSEEVVVLRTARLPLDTTERARPLDVDILPCLNDPFRMDWGGGQGSAFVYSAPATQVAEAPTCDVLVYVSLVSGGQTLDQTATGPYSLRLGEEAVAEPAFLFAGSTLPTVQLPAVAVFVDDSLVRVPVVARDVDRNLAGFDAYVNDSAYTWALYFSYGIHPPVDSVVGALYGFVPIPALYTQMRAVVSARDSKYASSAPDTTPVIIASATGLAATGVTATRVAGNATVNFTLADGRGTASQVEVLFRDPAAYGYYDSGLLLPVCERAIAPGDGAKSVTCPAPDLAGAQVVVIPLAGPIVGHAGRGTLP